MEYLEKELNLLWLDCFDFLSYAKKTVLLKLYDAEHDIRCQMVEYLPEFQAIMDRADFDKMRAASNDEYFNRVLMQYKKDSVIPVTRYSEHYPALLRETDNPPHVLYCKGNIDLLNTRCVAIVGTRRPSEYGKIITKQFAKELAKAGITIVSGLANGVDTIAHEATLAEGGNTIAVLAGGFNHIYPSSNFALAQKIADTNLLVCENRPDVQPMSYMFPIRNRILAGISEGVLITEAMENSGSLHTKNYAVDYGRELYIVPGRITSLESKGCNRVLKEMQGAITLSPSDILDRMSIDYNKNISSQGLQLGFDENAILRMIVSEKHSYQEILDETKLPPQQLNAVLLSLQIRGLLEKLPGNYYIAN